MKLTPDAHTTDLKDIVFDLMEEKKIESFTVNFDGSGDSGQVDCISLPDEVLEEKVSGVKVPNGIRYSSTGTEQMYEDADKISDVIEAVCYQILEQVCSGWEINDGSFGEFTFNVKKRKVSLDFNERVTDVNSSTYSF